MEVKLVSITKPLGGSPESLMAYTARVSSPNQDNPNFAGLLGYCIKHSHWSVFELADMTVEIITSRAIAQQILRHRSFSFQEFSQRYAKVSGYELYEARSQDNKNRQNSIDDLSDATKASFLNAQKRIWEYTKELYDSALEAGVAKEQARFLLPLNTTTKMYMKGSVRSWIHYLILRTSSSTQLEHRNIANGIKEIFSEQFPETSKALEWT